MLGTPRFSDTHLANLSSTQGPLAAWQGSIDRNVSQAALGVTGDFAVALRETNGRTFMAVDRFAIHPLCYRVVDGQLRFATRADELADANTEIDPQAIFDYLYFHVIPSPRTLHPSGPPNRRLQSIASSGCSNNLSHITRGGLYRSKRARRPPLTRWIT